MNGILDLKYFVTGRGEKLITSETLPEARKGTGKVYQILTETMERYWNKQSLLYWTKLSAELDARKTEAYKANLLFPYEFFDAMADAVLRWHQQRFKGTDDIEIKPLFQRLWKYHRMYLGVPLTDELVEQFMAEGDAIVAGQNVAAKEIILQMVIAICNDLDRRNPTEEQKVEKTDEQAGETTSSEKA